MIRKQVFLKSWKVVIFSVYWIINSFSAHAQDLKPEAETIHFQNGIAVHKQIVVVNANDIEIHYDIQNTNDFSVEQELSFSIPEESSYLEWPIAQLARDIRFDDRMHDELYYYDPYNYRNFRFFINTQQIFPNLETIKVKENCNPGYCFRKSSRFSWVQSLAPQSTTTLKTIYSSKFGYISARGLKPSVFAYFIEMQWAHFRKYCADDAFVEALRKQQEIGFLTVYDRHIDGKLILMDGDWQEQIVPITQLIIDKGKAENFVSFCGDGVKKISPTRFIIEQKNAHPIRTAHVLILKGWRKRAINFQSYDSEEYDPELLNYR